jgi:hypothetical protein
MRDRWADQVRGSEGFSYLIIAGVRESDGTLPVIKRRHRVVSFGEDKDIGAVIKYVVDQGWFPRNTRWIEVYRVLPVTEGEKNHRRFDLDTLFKESSDEDRFRKQAG